MVQELDSIGSELRDEEAAQKKEHLNGLHLAWMPIKHPCICRKLVARLNSVGCKE